MRCMLLNLGVELSGPLMIIKHCLESKCGMEYGVGNLTFFAEHFCVEGINDRSMHLAGYLYICISNDL